MLMRRRVYETPLCVLVAVAMAGACGSDSPGSTGSTPVVTTIEISPTAPSVFIADTLQLSATVKDQSGSVMTGKTLTWASSNPAAATVSTTGLVIGVASGTATITASVDGKQGTALLTIADPGPRITTESGTSASATISSAGGSISTTSAAGIQYTLVVPRNALMTPTRITMTPITAVRKLPLSGGLAGGVAFEPAGLRFARAASLRVSVAHRPGGSQRPVGLSAEGDAAVLSIAPVLDSGTGVILPVGHFSDDLVGFGTTSDVEQILASLHVASTDDNFYFDSLLVLSAATPVDASAETRVMKDWFRNVVLPSFQHAANDQDLIRAMGEWDEWTDRAPVAVGISAPDSTTYPAEFGQLFPVAAERFGVAIDGNSNVCVNEQSFQALFNVLFWQENADDVGVATAAFELDRASILNTLCGKVVLTLSNLPSLMDLGVDYSMDFRFAVQFVLNGTPQVWPQRVDLPPSAELLIADRSGLTDDTGIYTTVVTPQLAGPVSVTLSSCLVYPGTTEASDVCGTSQIQAQVQGIPLFTFDDTSIDGWTRGVSGPVDSDNWGTVVWLPQNGGVVKLDGTGNPGAPNAWISKQIRVPTNATTLRFDASGHDRADADALLTVRVVDGTGSHTVFNQVIVGVDHTLDFHTYQVNVSAWRGQMVTLFFEQNDNGIQGIFPGGDEQIYLDNITIRPN